jgi:hypothetical protein
MGELEELRAHVAKLVAIVDEMTPCNDDCDVRAVFSWVDPADLQRVRDLRHVRDAEVAKYRTALEAIREMMSPKNRQRFVMRGPMAFASVYNVVEDALAGKNSER